MSTGSKAQLSVHFAKWGNVAELNAKVGSAIPSSLAHLIVTVVANILQDSSQETVISLMGMLVGFALLCPLVPGDW